MASDDVGKDALPAGAAAVAAVGEEAAGLAGGAVTGAFDLLHACLAESPLGRRAEIQAPVDDDVGAEAAPEGLRHLLADFVAADADPRPDRRGQRRGAARRP